MRERRRTHRFFLVAIQGHFSRLVVLVFGIDFELVSRALLSPAARRGLGQFLFAEFFVAGHAIVAILSSERRVGVHVGSGRASSSLELALDAVDPRSFAPVGRGLEKGIVLHQCRSDCLVLPRVGIPEIVAASEIVVDRGDEQIAIVGAQFKGAGVLRGEG